MRTNNIWYNHHFHVPQFFFISQARSKYLYTYFFSLSFHFTLCNVHNFPSSFLFVDYYKIWSSGWLVWMSKSQRTDIIIIIIIIRRCPWCNGYRRRKWTRRLEFKSWTRRIAFHTALIPLGMVWIQLFSLQLWVNSRTDWVLQPWWGN